MPLIPTAAFLTGALLSLLLPVALLIALSVWYWVFSARVPATGERRRAGIDQSEANPGPRIEQKLPHDPGV